jgi:hypothetical protein
MTDLPYWTLHEAPPDSPKKWVVRVPSGSGRGREVAFGARGYEDFTTHHDVERRERYHTRHQRDRLDDPYAPGFWSMWALWGESDDLDTAFADAVKRAKKILKKTGEPAMTRRRNPVREPFNFTHYEEYASRLTDAQLHHAIIDALNALKTARTWDDGGVGEAKYLDQISVMRREQKARGMRSNPRRPLRADLIEKAREAGRNDAMNFGDGLAERRDYLAQAGWRSLDDEDRKALLKAWDEGAREVRHNPEWARKVGHGLYRGTRRAAKYAAEVSRDLYHGAREAHRTHRSNPRLSACAQQYLETALWSSSDEDGHPLDDQFDVSDFAPEAIQQAEKDCLDFLSTNDVGDLDEEQVGHNFWLTRNRHGAGFWDLGLGALGDRLTKAAHVYGSCDVYLGDDGKLYLS